MGEGGRGSARSNGTTPRSRAVPGPELQIFSKKGKQSSSDVTCQSGGETKKKSFISYPYYD